MLLSARRFTAAQIQGPAGHVALKTSLEDFQTTADTLVVYVYSNTNSAYQRNFHFFIQHGIQPKDHHHYIIVIQDGLVTLSSFTAHSSVAHLQHAHLTCMHSMSTQYGLRVTASLNQSKSPVANAACPGRRTTTGLAGASAVPLPQE